MLHPRFFAPPEELAIAGGDYHVIWYSQVEDYTLLSVRYTPSDRLQSFEFEVLYYKFDFIAGREHDGQIPELYTEIPEAVKRFSQNPIDRIPAQADGLGVPSSTAISLREEKNRIYFQ
jgi:hypothetical protein